MIWGLAYVTAIVAVNVGFQHLPPLHLGYGGVWPPMSLFVGIIFVLRDYAQREAGAWLAVAWMLLGAFISWFMASPAIALASLAAFVISETVDFAVYTATRWSMTRRVLVSSLVSAPIDSFAFLYLVHAISATAVVVMTASKALGILTFMAAKAISDSDRGGV